MLILRGSPSKSTNFHVKTISIDTEEEGPIKVKLQIWDTGGQERFSSIRPMYYRGSLGALLIFDLTSYESFEHLPQWIEEIRANVKSDIPLLLVGNKSDLVDQRAVSLDEINNFTENFNLYYMETSAKTGEGVGDCFYILACLMVGSGVPDQLISEQVVSAPGQISTSTPSIPSVTSPEIKTETKLTAPTIKSEVDYAAPPVPEPNPALAPEPEEEFMAPPVPEPEVEFSAPPVHEPTSAVTPKPEERLTTPPVPEPKPVLTPEPEEEFMAPPVPEPTINLEVEPEIEFNVPPSSESEVESVEPQIPEKVIEEEKKPAFSVPSKISISSESPAYKPKTIPFTTNVPTPATPPEEFKRDDSESESLVDYMPETILSKKERKKLEKQRKKEEKERKLRERREKAAKLKEKMQSVGKEEKEKIDLEKQRKKEEKERELEEKREKAAKLKEKMQSVGKEKSEKIIPKTEQPSIPFQAATPEIKQDKKEAPSLFKTLTQKAEKPKKASSSSFVPFSEKESSEKSETSSLRIIPNVANLDKNQKSSAESKAQSIPFPSSKESYSPEIQPAPTAHSTKESSERKEIIICKQCGAMLSSDYAFCNKCGAKL
ncbi:MAG: GTP-binding protein [Promethearchaeota archaeon]|nr:MAG: GTP-binding protein [Candidatus Lokiarchaeota archaeon]